MKKEHFNFFLSPWVILSGMIGGVLIGIYLKPAVPYIKPVGDAYLSILQMCVIPIMASAIIISMGKMIKSKNTNKELGKIFIVFTIFLFTVAIISAIFGIITGPGKRIDQETRKFIGNMIIEKSRQGTDTSDVSLIVEIDSENHIEQKGNKGGVLIPFLINIIPENIFKALSHGENLKIIFFCFLLGLMLKFIPSDSSSYLLILFEGIFDVFQKIIIFSLYFLPFGLCSLIAAQISRVGISMLLSLLLLIILVYILALIIFFISTIIIWIYSEDSYFAQFKALKDAIILALGTRSSFATIPSCLMGLTKNMRLDESRINLSLPLGITLCRYGNTLIFAFMSVFAAQLYDKSVGINGFIVILIGSILASMATSGAPGIVARTMIGIILIPLGLPSGAIIVILIAIDPIIDPISTLINVYPNCASATVISKKLIGRKKDKVIA